MGNKLWLLGACPHQRSLSSACSSVVMQTIGRLSQAGALSLIPMTIYILLPNRPSVEVPASVATDLLL